MFGEEDILVTGATGYLGKRLVALLLQRGSTRVSALHRPGAELPSAWADRPEVTPVEGNLLDSALCERLVQSKTVIYHLAAQRGTKSVPEAVMNTVVATRNLWAAAAASGHSPKCVLVSSFTVYDNARRRGPVLDEDTPLEQDPEGRGEAYCYAKVFQETVSNRYSDALDMRIVRPGAIYGENSGSLSSRVGIGTFGIFLHLGGGNPIPLTYVDNCAWATALAGTARASNGDVFNIVDDDLPSSADLLRRYREEVASIRYLSLPKPMSWALCSLWEQYSRRSKRQLPNAYNRKMWANTWRRTSFSNQRLRSQLKWSPLVSTEEGLNRYFHAMKENASC